MRFGGASLQRSLGKREHDSYAVLSFYHTVSLSAVKTKTEASHNAS